MEICALCSSSRRDQNLICVVEKPFDVLILEKSGVYQGVYHVLGGVISPMDGMGPEKLNLAHLLERLQNLSGPEIILALPTSSEGETTVLYILRLLKETSVKITRLARGIPLGSSLEYVDDLTMQNAFSSRVSL